MKTKATPTTPVPDPKPSAATIHTPSREYFLGQEVALLQQIQVSERQTAEYRGALNLVRGQRKLFFPDAPAPTPPPAPPAAAAPSPAIKPQ
jgi:hypothetical protein